MAKALHSRTHLAARAAEDWWPSPADPQSTLVEATRSLGDEHPMGWGGMWRSSRSSSSSGSSSSVVVVAAAVVVVVVVGVVVVVV